MREAGLKSIPIVDLAQPASVVPALEAACRSWGFFQLVGHGVPRTLIEAALADARAFFALPRTAKRQVERSLDNPWGYYDRELTKTVRDRKEIFDIGPDTAEGGAAPFEGETPWPAAPESFRSTMLAYRDQCAALAARLLGLICEGLLYPPAELVQQFIGRDTSFLRLNHYPVDDPLEGEALAPGKFGIHHHTDAGALTLLLQDEVPGLQVRHEGRWHLVRPREDAFIVNIGDMVQVWSNDLFAAPLHRVLAMENEPRLSLAFFYNPPYETMVAPLLRPAATEQPHYRPIPWGEFRRRRADGDYANYGREVQISDYRLPAQASPAAARTGGLR